MYGVVWITPPKRPASTEASPSVQRILRVSYSSPAAAALSVQSIPPTIVARANGNITGNCATAWMKTGCHQDQLRANAGKNSGSPHAGVG